MPSPTPKPSILTVLLRVLKEVALLRDKRLAGVLAGVVVTIAASAFGASLPGVVVASILGGIGLVAGMLENLL